MRAGKRQIRLSSKKGCESNSFSYSQRRHKQLNHSELSNYIDSCLFQRKNLLPDLGKKPKKQLPEDSISHISSYYSPLQVLSKSNNSPETCYGLNRNHTPLLSDMRRTVNKLNRRSLEVGKSQDNKILMFIQGFSECRPKSVVFTKKVSCIMQTDDYML